MLADEKLRTVLLAAQHAGESRLTDRQTGRIEEEFK